MKTCRTEKHFIKQGSSIYNTIDELCHKSKNIYNYANYIVRQEFINNKNWIRYNELAGVVKDSTPYKELGSNTGQQTLRILDRAWKSFFVAIGDWSKNKSKYLGKPNLPSYLPRDGRFVLVADKNKFSIESDSFIRFSWKPLRVLNGKFKTKSIGRPIQIRFVPKKNLYVMELVYEVVVPELVLETSRIIGIDIGVNNLATVGNNARLQPFIINGKPLKSMNQYYNKKKAKFQSELKIKHDKNWSNRLQQLTQKRNNKIDDYMHKASRFVVDYCIRNNFDTIVIGKNDGWKQKVQLYKRINQNFTQIPFDSFIHKIQYKAEDAGIKVITTEESYTSGTSFLDNEKPNKGFYNKSRRVARGLFKSDSGDLINADLNASYQIIKKVFPKAFANGIEGVDLHPVIVNI